VRLTIYVFGDGSVFDTQEWPVYLGVVIAAYGGVMIGTWSRKFISSERLVHLLQVLIFLSSALMLGATQDASVAAAYGIIVIVGAVVFGLGMCFPSHVGLCAGFWRQMSCRLPLFRS
jgi:hypothetical protein